MYQAIVDRISLRKRYSEERIADCCLPVNLVVVEKETLD